MNNESRAMQGWKRGARLAAILLGVGVALLGCLVLVGWLIDSETLKSLSPRFAEMKANTAVGFICVGASLVILQLERFRRLAHALAAAVVVLGAATLSQYVFGWELGIDELLFSDATGGLETLSPGRMGANTAFNFTVVGVSLLLLDVERRGLRPAQIGAAIVFVVALVVLLGYAFDAPRLERGFIPENFTPMATHTAVAFGLVSLALMVSRPSTGIMVTVTSQGAGGLLVRRLLAPALVLTVALGYLRLEGQRAGLYGTEEGVALFATSLIVVIGGLILITAQSLERVDAERRAVEARERAVVEAALDCIITIDEQGRVTDFNPVAERTFGYTRAEALGREIGELIVPPSLRHAHRRGLARLAATGETRIAGRRLELTAMRSDGSEFPVELEIARLRSSGAAAFVGHVRDISERVEAQRATSRLAAIVESSLDAIVATELDGTITAWNPAAERLYGYAAEQIIGRSASVLLPPDEVGDLPVLLDRVRRGETFEHEAERVRTNGEPIHLSLTAFPVRGGSGEVVAAAVIVRDLSERRRLEEQLRQAQKIEAIGQLAGGVAHDFNNLLTVIAGYAGVARNQVGAGPGGSELEEIEQAAWRAADLTNQLLAFSRKQLLDPVLLDLNEVVETLLPMLGRLLGEEIEIGALADDGLPPVFVDRSQVEQVIVNLAVNARDAMPRGGTLTIETRTALLDERDAREHDVQPGDYACMTVTDTGSGIDPETLEHIFEPFYTTKDVGQGTGLGLATVHGVVAQSDGYVSVSSELDLGTTFKVYFPRAESDAEPPATADAERDAEALGGAETILLCEDNDAVRRYIGTMLSEEGYTVLPASTPQEAIDLAGTTARTIDVLVTDVAMPGMSGTELAEQLHDSLARPRVLYLSGHTAEALRSRGLEPGGAFVQKPIEPVELLSALRDLLDAPESKAPITGTAEQVEDA